MILTSNRGLAEWGQVFGDAVIATALLDRLLHRAVVVHIEGSSYGMRQQIAANDALADAIAAKGAGRGLITGVRRTMCRFASQPQPTWGVASGEAVRALTRSGPLPADHRSAYATTAYSTGAVVLRITA